MARHLQAYGKYGDIENICDEILRRAIMGISQTESNAHHLEVRKYICELLDYINAPQVEVSAVRPVGQRAEDDSRQTIANLRGQVAAYRQSLKYAIGYVEEEAI